jgi:hypothetical protein
MSDEDYGFEYESGSEEEQVSRCIHSRRRVDVDRGKRVLTLAALPHSAVILLRLSARMLT